MQQRNSGTEPWVVHLQEWQSRTETFDSNLNAKDTFNIICVVIDFTAIDGLCGLLQNNTRGDRSHPKALCPLHPETKTHTGSCYTFMCLNPMQWQNYTLICVHHHILLLVSLQDMKTSRTDHCRKMSYHSGAPTLLAVRTKWSSTKSKHSTLHRPKNM